jgi:hypothetical protein
MMAGMRQAKQPQRNRILSGIVTGVLLLCSSCAWSLELKTVLDNTAVTPPARVEFREERYNPMLKEPILLSGYLEYLESGHLRKVVETPFEEAFLITEGYIEIERDGETRRLSVGKSKLIRAMLGGIEAILAGQADKLDSLFRYELSGTEDCWSLHLEPLSRKIARQLKSMLVQGDEHSTHSIRLDLKDGEWSLMEISPAEVQP